jgi:hypothetical protein
MTSLQTKGARGADSARVRHLFAAMLTLLVKVEFGYTMREGEAMDLAHHHSLSEAIASIRDRMEINRQFPDRKLRNTLAIQEATVLATVGPGDSDSATKLILQAREAAFDVIKARDRARDQASRERELLTKRMKEIKTWGRVNARFIDALTELYNDRLVELWGLNLPNELRSQATTELDKLFETAIEAAE